MKAKVYKQAFDHITYEGEDNVIEVSQDELKRGFTKIDCPDCKGTGIFQLPEGSTKCTACKGSGKRYVNLI